MFGNVSLAIHPNNVVSLQGLLSGELYVAGTWLFVRGQEGDAIGVAWPPGTVWETDEGSISVRGQKARVGDDVNVSGGLVDVDGGRVDRIGWVVPPRPDCLGDYFWFAGSLEVIPP